MSNLKGKVNCGNAKVTVEGPAKVGQLIEVTEVNDDGWPTSWKAVDKVEVVKRTLYPELKQEYKDALKALLKNYYDNRDNFIYEYNHSRDLFTGGGCFDTNEKKFNLNCATFVQMVMMGRSVYDFVGKNENTYSPEFEPVFDFGYYFEFLDRKYMYGLKKETTSEDENPFYGWHNPNSDKNNYVGSYSYNSYYSPKAEKDGRPFAQALNMFCFANDMARELQEKGCEIPYSELDVGDIVFFYDIDPTDNDLGLNKVAWKNITHVGFVYSFSPSNNRIAIIDCAEEKGVIVMRGTGFKEAPDILAGGDLLRRVAMCARMPIAFGIESNVKKKMKITLSDTPLNT
jgi:hypothetical protein